MANRPHSKEEAKAHHSVHHWHLPVTAALSDVEARGRAPAMHDLKPCGQVDLLARQK
jgi:hypothetical protein